MNWKYYRPKFEYEEKLKDIGWPWAGHKFFAYDLVRNIKPKRIVELGTHYGTSFFSFCQAAKDEALNTDLYAIDTWAGDKHAGFYGDEVFEKVSKISSEYYPHQNIMLLKKTFDEALKDFSDKSIDILHIDGLHTYEGAKHDYRYWRKKVKDDGIILFHDIFVKETDFGVYRLWDELKKNHSVIEFSHSYGLGIMFLDNKLGSEIAKIQKDLQMHYAYAHGFRQYMEIENLILAVKNKEEELKKKTDSCKFEIQEATIYYQNLIKEEKEKNKQKEQIIQQKKQVLQQKDQMIRQKEKEIKMMKSSKFWKIREKYINLKSKLGIR